MLSALRNGYRHIDTVRCVHAVRPCGVSVVWASQAVVYWNEEEVGKAVIDSGIPREEIYITTKLAPADHGYDKARASALASIARLQVEYVDLLLIHWPGTAGVMGMLECEQ